MALFFPQAHTDIDWSRGYEMLDKELQGIVRQAKQGRRYVDKLVKLWLKSREERWLLIHVEVQTWKEGDFPKRMHVYDHRIFDRYDREVISLAILADDDPPGGRASMGTPAGASAPARSFRLSSWWTTRHCQALEADPNPFATVVLAHLKTLETRRAPAERQAWKVRLVKRLYERGMDREDVRQLFRFIDWIMELPEALERLFWQEITAYQQEKRMPFITIAERVGIEKGLIEGIEACLKLKFGAEGLELMPEIRELQDHELLRAVLHAIRAAASPDELRRVWTRRRRSKKAGRG
jgi:hypothetical protein